jgi:hypothetical protein
MEWENRLFAGLEESIGRWHGGGTGTLGREIVREARGSLADCDSNCLLGVFLTVNSTLYVNDITRRGT